MLDSDKESIKPDSDIEPHFSDAEHAAHADATLVPTAASELDAEVNAMHDELERGLFGPVPPPARSLAELGVVVSVQGLGFRVYE